LILRVLLLRCMRQRNEPGCVVGEHMQKNFNVAAPTTLLEVAISSRFIIFLILEREDPHTRFNVSLSEVRFVLFAISFPPVPEKRPRPSRSSHCCCCKADRVEITNTFLVRFNMIETNEQTGRTTAHYTKYVCVECCMVILCHLR
jgi:hypothetical protein